MSDTTPLPIDPESPEARKLLSDDERLHEEALARAFERGQLCVDDVLDN